MVECEQERVEFEVVDNESEVFEIVGDDCDEPKVIDNEPEVTDVCDDELEVAKPPEWNDMMVYISTAIKEHLKASCRDDEFEYDDRKANETVDEFVNDHGGVCNTYNFLQHTPLVYNRKRVMASVRHTNGEEYMNCTYKKQRTQYTS